MHVCACKRTGSDKFKRWRISSLILIKYHSTFLKLERIKRDFVTPVLICLQVLVPPGEREYHGGNIGEERIMEDHECPLAIAMDFPPAKGMKKLKPTCKR